MTTKEEIMKLAGEPTEFKRENKYLVLKLGDIAKFLTRDEQFKLDALIAENKRLVEALERAKSVIESAGYPVDTSITLALATVKEKKPCEHHYVMDDEAPRHHCCQKCGNVKTQ